jgi:iron complex outermembrane receptor protein
MCTPRFFSGLYALCASLAIAPWPGTIRAQELSRTLEEITVTATRAQTNRQQTPMSVEVFAGADLENSGIETGRDLAIMVPNVVVNPGVQGERDPIMTIRGLPGVTTYVDGVWVGNWGFLLRSFVELERLEVLRGPQGTLFGRNSNGGAIQLVTRKPGDEFGVQVDTKLGNYDRRALAVAADWPIAERLKTRWTAAADESAGFLDNPSALFSLGDRDDSMLRADIVWEPTNDLSLRFVASAERSDGSDARIVRISNPGNPAYIAYNVLAGNSDYLDVARNIDPAFPDPPVALAGDRYTRETHQSGSPGGMLGRWQTKSDMRGPTYIADSRHEILTLDWGITRRFSLLSLTSHATTESRQGVDYDASEFTFRSRIDHDRPSVTTQELQLTGNHFDGRLKSLLGLYYQHYRHQRRQYIWANWEFAVANTGPNPGTPGPPGVGGRPLINTTVLDYVRAWGATVGNSQVAGYVPFTFATSDRLEEQKDTDRALFGQAAIRLLDSLELTLGFRFTTDDGGFSEYLPAEALRPLEPGTVADGDLYAAAAVITAESEPDFGTATTPRVSIAYRPTGRIYLYASYAEGFTSSEVVSNPFAPEPIVLRPEVVTTRELGLRSDFLDGRLRLNATGFDSQWNGLRVRKLLEDPGNPGSLTGLRIPTSDGVAEATGFELDLSLLLGELWALDLGLGLLDTEYIDIGDPPPNGTGLQPGIPFQYAPEASATLGVRYRRPLAKGELTFAADYGWMGEYERAAASDFQTKSADGTARMEPAYGIFNARVVYRPASGNWQLSLFGKNLTNEWYVNGGIDVGRYEAYDFATIGRPRELGAGLRLCFD